MLEDFRLKVFLTVVKERSFTAAALKLDVSQSAVSQNISELEKQTGVRLLVRQRGCVVPTEQGETFALFARRILQAYEDLNTVFSDYHAYEEVSRQVKKLADEPSFRLFRDALIK